MNNYYTYALINPFTNQPFYIGKGKKNRAMDHINEALKTSNKESNPNKLNTIREILSNNGKVIIKYIDTNLTEKLAFELEIFVIELLGRSNNNTGILTNMTKGGEGCGGENNPNYGKRGEDSIWWGRHHTEETKRKQSEKQKGKIISEEHKQNMRKPKSEQGRLNIAKARLESDYRPSEETKRKTSETLKGRPSPNKGRPMTEENKQMISERFLGVPKTKIECPHCKKMTAVHTAKRWHFDNCKELVI